MTDLNSLVIVCRVTQEIGENDFGYISTGTAKLTLHVANNESRKKGDNWEDVTSFFDVVYWGKPAENIKAKIHKGLLLGVSGRLKQDRWEKDGQKQSRITIQADNCYLLGGKSEGGAAPQSAPAPQNDGGYEPQSGDFPEDIPF